MESAWDDVTDDDFLEFQRLMKLSEDPNFMEATKKMGISLGFTFKGYWSLSGHDSEAECGAHVFLWESSKSGPLTTLQRLFLTDQDDSQPPSTYVREFKTIWHMIPWTA